VDHKTGVSKKVGVVKFATEEGKAAAFKLNKTTVNGEKISVAPSKFEPTSAVAGGGAGGAEVEAAASTTAAAPKATFTATSTTTTMLKPRSLKLKL
jgi:hypothetical protein